MDNVQKQSSFLAKRFNNVNVQVKELGKHLKKALQTTKIASMKVAESLQSIENNITEKGKRKMIFFGKAGSGKTTLLIETAHVKRLPILCATKERAMEVNHYAEYLGLDIPEAITVTDLNKIPFNDILIDDIESVLCSLINKNVDTMTTRSDCIQMGKISFVDHPYEKSEGIKSGWVINFKDDFKVILTEEEYLIYKEKFDRNEVKSEEHWLSIEEVRKKHPELKQAGIGFFEDGKSILLGGEGFHSDQVGAFKIKRKPF